MYEILSLFKPITLEEMAGIRLMNRTDTKFVCNSRLLAQLLEMAKDNYRVQQTGGRRVACYATAYFDTPDRQLYLAHHNGRLTRQKVRIRFYVDSDLHFLEVKNKNNHRRTKKLRCAVYSPDDAVIDGHRDFLRDNLRCDVGSLCRALDNSFERITLVNNALTERLTIDSALRVDNPTTGRSASLDGLVIIELKRDGLEPSPISDMLLRLRIKPMGFSKYCIGQALTDPAIKQNRFKERLRVVYALIGQNLAAEFVPQPATYYQSTTSQWISNLTNCSPTTI